MKTTLLTFLLTVSLLVSGQYTNPERITADVYDLESTNQAIFERDTAISNRDVLLSEADQIVEMWVSRTLQAVIITDSLRHVNSILEDSLSFYTGIEQRDNFIFSDSLIYFFFTDSLGGVTYRLSYRDNENNFTEISTGLFGIHAEVQNSHFLIYTFDNDTLYMPVEQQREPNNIIFQNLGQ